MFELWSQRSDIIRNLIIVIVLILIIATMATESLSKTGIALLSTSIVLSLLAIAVVYIDIKKSYEYKKLIYVKEFDE